MQPGYELNQQLTEVFGGFICNNYSTDIRHAMDLAERIHYGLADGGEGYNYLTLEALGAFGDERWAASFDLELTSEWYEQDQIERYAFAARGRTPEHAISLAALKLGHALLADYKAHPHTPRRRLIIIPVGD